MNETTTASMIQRVELLECSLRRWQRGTLGILLVALAGMLMGLEAQSTKVVTAERFIVKRSDGKILAILGDWAGDAISIPEPGESGYETAELGLGTRAGGYRYWGLHLFGANGKYLAGLRTSPSEFHQDDNGWLVLKDAETTSRIDLAVGSAYADLHMRAASLSHADYDREWDEYIKKWKSAKTPEEKLQAESLKTPAEKEARLVMTNEHASLSLHEKGMSRIVLGQTVLKGANEVEESRPLSSLVLFDRKGKVVHELP
jgi:hypothetical protein